MATLCRKLKWLVFFWDTVYKTASEIVKMNESTWTLGLCGIAALGTIVSNCSRRQVASGALLPAAVYLSSFRHFSGRPAADVTLSQSRVTPGASDEMAVPNRNGKFTQDFRRAVIS